MGAQGETLSWFDDPAFPGAYAGGRDSGGGGEADVTRFSVGLDAGRMLGRNVFPSLQLDGYESQADGDYADRVDLFGGVERDDGEYFFPQAHGAVSAAALPANGLGRGRTNVLGIKWRHKLDSENSLAIATRYGDNVYLDQSLQDAAPYPLETYATMTSVAWTSSWMMQGKPRIIGSIFIGDEIAKEESYHNLARKYYGFTLGGQMTLFQNHMPYVSFKLQRSDYFSEDREVFALRNGLHSRLSAGWNWQVHPNWSLRAGADYTVNDFELNLYKYDRSRLFFSTRFDFR